MITKHTPGPWYWHIDMSGRISLRTPDRGQLIVMDFVRKGMSGATPRLAVWPGMNDGAERSRLGGILGDFDPHHPDARLISASPDLLAACEAALAHVDELGEAWRTGAITECDGRGGERSNRNFAAAKVLRAAIAKAKGGGA